MCMCVCVWLACDGPGEIVVKEKEMAGIRVVDCGNASLAGAQKDRKKVKLQGSFGCIWKSSLKYLYSRQG